MLRLQLPLGDRYTDATSAELADRIAAAKATLGDRLFILGHHYQTDEVIQHADYTGDSLKLTALETKPESRTSADDLFIHSTIFVLVDKQARLRGAFETGGDGIEWTNIQPAIISAIKQLEQE